MRTRRSFLLPSFGIASIGALLAAVACTTGTSSTPTPPVPGVVVRAESVIPSGKCGSGPGQLSRWVAVLKDLDNASNVVGMTLLPCWTDAYFTDLTSVHYAIDVYTFSADMEAAAYTGSDPSFPPRSGPCDAGAIDSGAIDSGAIDSGAIDSGAIDAGAIDAGDGGTSDAAADASDADADASAEGGAEAGAGPDAGVCAFPRTNAEVITEYGRVGNLAGLLSFPVATRLACAASQPVDPYGNLLKLQVIAACSYASGDAAADAPASDGSSDAQADAPSDAQPQDGAGD